MKNGSERMWRKEMWWGGREGGREEGRKGAYRKENTLVENRFLITMFRERLGVF